MSHSRREFLSQSALGLVAAAVTSTEALSQAPTPATPGAPPAFGTGPAAGPEVSVTTFVEAEKLVQVEMTQGDLAQAAGNWRVAMAPLYERRVGPRKITIPSTSRPTLAGRPRSPTNSRSPHATASSAPSPQLVRYPPPTTPSPTRRSIISRAGSKPANSPASASPTSISSASASSTRRSTASSPSPATTLSPRPAKPTPRSLRATTAARSTASPGEPKTCSTPPTSPPPGAPSPSATASPPPTPPSPSASTTPEPSSSPSSPSAPSPSTTSGSAVRP